MDKKQKRDVPRPETSLLFPANYSFEAWSNMQDNNMFMPVAVASPPSISAPNEEISAQSEANSKSFSASSSQYSETISQSQQPLFAQLSNPGIPSNGTSVPIEDQRLSAPPSVEIAQCEPRDLNAQLFKYEQFHTIPPSPVTPNSDIDQRFMNTALPISSSNVNNYMPPKSFIYNPIIAHWFYKEIIESREVWFGFSPMDSANLEDAHQRALQQPTHEEFVVSTHGGRYDVHVKERLRHAVYWSETSISVRRCTWFYKSETSQHLVPYDEMSAFLIEDAFEKCLTSGAWHKNLFLDNGEVIVIENPRVVLHYANRIDTWPTVSDEKAVPKIAVRGVPSDVTILPDEVQQIDHLVFVVQGIGSVCDLRFRTVSQCVDGFREISNRLIPAHFSHGIDTGKVGRVEFLPLPWHQTLHTNNVDLDKRLKTITLPSIPKLRYFTNDTLLDILLYSSPIYCQTIIDTVATGLNNLYSIFITRNPTFSGKVSVAGHSLGSLILFDILSNQLSQENKQDTSENFGKLQDVCLSSFQNNSDGQVASTAVIDNQENLTFRNDTAEHSLVALFKTLGLEDYVDNFLTEKIDTESLMFCEDEELKALGLPMGPRKKLQAFIKSETAKIGPESNALHGAIVMHETQKEEDAIHVRGVALPNSESCGSFDKTYPSCITETTLSSITFPKLQFNPSCFFALGSPISMFLAVRGFSTISKTFNFPSCTSFFHIFHPYDPVAFRIEPLIDPSFTAKPVLIPHHKGRKRMHIEIRENIAKVSSELKQKVIETLRYTWEHLNVFTKTSSFPSEAVEAEVNNFVSEQMRTESIEENQANVSDVDNENIQIGCLNGGRRIDYVLQEKPIEALNEYIFALTSHATYWDSEDTVLMFLKEIYALDGVMPSPILTDSTNVGETSHLSRTVSQSNFPGTSPYSSFLPESKGTFSSSVQNLHVPNKTESVVSAGITNVKSPFIADLDHRASPSVPSQPIGPPPLSGFVKKSPFSKP